MQVAALAAHVAAVVAVIWLVAMGGRALARLLRQPEVIGEVLAGLLVGPVMLWLVGGREMGQLLPGPVLGVVQQVSNAGLALFLVSVVYHVPGEKRRHRMGWVVAGALIPALLCGIGLAGWLLLDGNTVVVGGARPGALVVFLAAGLAVTAVPVLARILTDKGLTDTVEGRLALRAAIVIDSAGWLLATVAIGLQSGTVAGVIHSVVVLVCGVLAALVFRVLLRSAPARALSARRQVVMAVLLGGLALASSAVMQQLGLTGILGAALVGLAVPTDGDGPWPAVVAKVGSVGRHLVPLFFVITGVSVLTRGFVAPAWPVLVVAVLLGVLGKIGGGYLGARLSGHTPMLALRIGALVNTRGLTELVVLQVGVASGILSPPLFLALLVMALATTAMTGPLLTLLDRWQARAVTVPAAVELGNDAR
ncbi:cation:proton antiporter [Kutzneria buriramensis]|uniref:Kef-type K+ transport system membrane component KefB n=1 Tax=Kutzneria buriramensis TaxID=1045776 RepID=A0A3E0HR58_9PSEU|nr:cation:proton antiporter [Kutzneria buriramensis]REH48475.1 Kef-type K+ transport system membrane component KefB [Kutzneria buriramensis]